MKNGKTRERKRHVLRTNFHFKKSRPSMGRAMVSLGMHCTSWWKRLLCPWVGGDLTTTIDSSYRVLSKVLDPSVIRPICARRKSTKCNVDMFVPDCMSVQRAAYEISLPFPSLFFLCPFIFQVFIVMTLHCHIFSMRLWLNARVSFLFGGKVREDRRSFDIPLVLLNYLRQRFLVGGSSWSLLFSRMMFAYFAATEFHATRVLKNKVGKDPQGGWIAIPQSKEVKWTTVVRRKNRKV